MPLYELKTTAQKHNVFARASHQNQIIQIVEALPWQGEVRIMTGESKCYVVTFRRVQENP
jgi:hypothetical protein